MIQQVRQFPAQIPTHFHNAMGRVSALGQSAKNGVHAAWVWSRETELWQQAGKPFYERRIQPLKTSDYLLIGGSLALSAAITLIALQNMGIAAVPLAVGLCATAIFGTVAFSTYRVNRVFDAKAWDLVDGIRRAAFDITRQDQKFAPIEQYLGDLEKPEYKHREQEINDLKGQIKELKKAYLLNDISNKILEQRKDAFLTYLQKLQERLVKNKEIEKLENDVEEAPVAGDMPVGEK